MSLTVWSDLKGSSSDAPDVSAKEIVIIIDSTVVLSRLSSGTVSVLEPSSTALPFKVKTTKYSEVEIEKQTPYVES